MSSKQFIRMVSVAAIAAGMTTPAIAQEAPADSGIGEIVVTAEKRPSTEQKTPLSMTVLGADTLRKNGVANIEDVSRISPSVSITATAAAPIIAVRGVSSRDVTEIGDPAVAISIDGFNLQRATSLLAGFFDLERVEVLRGPQGTLLGRNATGGAINVITARPSDSFEAYVGGEVGSYDLYSTKGMINVPLTDNLAVRASFQTRDRNGYREIDGKNADDERTKAARVHVLWKPTDRLSMLLTGEYVHNSSVGTAINGIAYDTYTAANVPSGFAVGDYIIESPNKGSGNEYYSPAGGFMRYTVKNVRGEINYDLDFATLTYQGGYRNFTYARKYAFGGAPDSARKNISFEQYESVDTWNHELRLASNSTGPFKWQGGVYYFREKNDFLGLFTDYTDSYDMNGKPFVFQRFTYPDITAEAKAVFGQASYQIIDGLTFSAGARYSTDKKSRHFEIVSTAVNTYYSTRCDRTSSCNYTTSTGYQSVDSSKTTFHAGLDYQISPRNMVYAKFDTGYKAGGFTDISSYSPETVQAYEIGSKNRFFGNTLQINVSAYLYNYTNQQVSQALINSAGGVSQQILNAGKSRYKGIEIDALWQPTADDRLSLYLGYSHARYVNFATATSGTLLRYAQAAGRAEPVYNSSGAIVSYNYQMAGLTPPQAPDWTFNAGYEHDFHVLGGILTPRAQTHVESTSYFQFYNFASDRQRGYMRSDLLVTYTPDSKQWTLTAYVRNLEDRRILANAALPSPTYLTFRYQYQAPRTFGASFQYNF